MSSAELLSMLKRHGWAIERQKGSHVQLKNPAQPKLGTITVPHPKKDLAKGTERAILKQAGLK